MEIIKNYCDRCNKEIKAKKRTIIDYFLELDSVNSGHIKYTYKRKIKQNLELCYNCVDEFEKWFTKDTILETDKKF